MPDGISGPNGPHPRVEEAKEELTGSAMNVTEPREEDGSGPAGPHAEKSKAAAADSDGGALALEDDGSGPNGPH